MHVLARLLAHLRQRTDDRIVLVSNYTQVDNALSWLTIQMCGVFLISYDWHLTRYIVQFFSMPLFWGWGVGGGRDDFTPLTISNPPNALQFLVNNVISTFKSHFYCPFDGLQSISSLAHFYAWEILKILYPIVTSNKILKHIVVQEFPSVSISLSLNHIATDR